MKVLCSHHKGGVGKSFLAVHLAKALSKAGQYRVLLVDCDSQADSWRFFVHFDPPIREIPFQETKEGISLYWNSDKKPIRSVTDEDSYDHVILDIDSPLKNTVVHIMQSTPDVVLIPVNYQDLSLIHLENFLKTINHISDKTYNETKGVIVPLGVKKKDVQDFLLTLHGDLAGYPIFQKMRNMPKRTANSIKSGKPIWTYDGCGDVEKYFDKLVICLKKLIGER